MSAVFADTFYWFAVTNAHDRAHERAKAFTLSAPPGTICTTEEVLTEYLNYFAAWGPRLWRKVAINVHNMMDEPNGRDCAANERLISDRVGSVPYASG
jgi:hypothetical protein